MRKLGWMMAVVMFVVVGCGTDNSIPQIADDVTEEVAVLECSENTDCFNLGHTFCDHGVCNGEAPVQFEDVIVSDLTEEVADDTASDSEQEVYVGECISDADCQHLADVYCNAGWLMTQGGECQNGSCSAHLLSKENCTNGCSASGCLPESECSNDKMCSVFSGEFCTVDNQKVVWDGSGICVDEHCAGFMKFFDCVGSCELGQCTECNSDNDCNDEDECTDDQCVEGSCVHSEIENCCIPDDVCEDDNPCTDDFIDESTCACMHEFMAEGTLCDDGNPETTDDYCQGNKWEGLCLGHASWCEIDPPVPADAVLCTEFLYNTEDEECYYKGMPNGTPCEGGTCIWAICVPDGGCFDNSDCFDGNGCTDDLCIDHQCQYVTEDGCISCQTDEDCGVGGGAGCLDEYIHFSTESTGACLPAGYCEVISTENICDFVCNPITGQCTECAVNSDCDDMDPCSNDTCENGGCVHDVVSEACTLCDDDNECTFDIYKSNTDQCVHGYNPFVEGCCDTYDCNASCDENNVSFGMICEGFSIYDSLPCIDGIYQCCDGDEQCPTDSICVQGLCKYFECLNDSDCNDGNLETDDICVYGKCGWVENECSSDDDCSFGQFCADDYECDWTGDLQCRIYCPEDKPIVHLMYAEEEDISSGALWTWSQQDFFNWGWCHPTFKFNCHNGAGSWGGGNEAEVVCNASAEELELKHLGDGLVQVELKNLYSSSCISN